MKINKKLLISLKFKQCKNGNFLRKNISFSKEELDVLSEVEKDVIRSYPDFNSNNKTILVGKKLVAYNNTLLKHKGITFDTHSLLKVPNPFAAYSLSYKYIGMEIDDAIIIAKLGKDMKSLKALELIKTLI